MRWSAMLSGAVAFGFLLAGCADEPTSVGSGLLPPSDFLKADSAVIVAASSSSVRARPIDFVDRTRVTIGRNGTTQSWGLFLFTGFHDSLKTISIEKAELRLRANYHFGDSSAPFSVLVRKALRSWTSSELTLDSLLYQATGTPEQSFPSIGDTDVVSIPVDTAVVNSWLRNIGESENTNFGLILEPTNLSVIKGFASYSSLNSADMRPTLEMMYTQSGSSSYDTLRAIAAFDRFLVASSDTSFTTDSTTSFIRNGLAYRGKLNFDVASLPARAAILKATLEVTLNGPSSSLNSYSSADSVLAVFMTPYGFPEDTPDLRFPASPLSEVITVNGEKVYRFQVTEFVQQWVRGFPVRAVALAGITEANTLDIIAFHGSASSTAAFRPRILVIYATPQ